MAAAEREVLGNQREVNLVSGLSSGPFHDAQQESAIGASKRSNLIFRSDEEAEGQGLLRSGHSDLLLSSDPRRAQSIDCGAESPLGGQIDENMPSTITKKSLLKM